MKPLSDSTKYQYEGRLRKIATVCPDIKRISEHLSRVDDMYQNLQTRKGTYSAILWKLRSLEQSPERDASIQAVLKKFDDLKSACNAEAKQQNLTPNQMLNYMSYTDLLTLYNKATGQVDLGKEYNDELLYYTLVCLYVVQPPVRADYWNMEFVQLFDAYLEGQEDKMKAAHWIVKCPDRTKNYCIVCPTESYFVFQNYKTASTYGIQTVKAEWAVNHLLRHLAINLKQETVVPLATPNALVKAVKKAFAYFGGKEITIGLLRHSYIMEFYKKNPTILQKEELAKKMLHSRNIQEYYRSEDVEEDNI